MKFSANLGFLWADRPLPDAIRAAKAAGFDAVECHWPYAVPAAEVKAALDETGLPMLGLNTCRGDSVLGENGLSALPYRIKAARAGIDEAIEYGSTIGAKALHVMAGNDQGQMAYATFIENLRYASGLAKDAGMTILIEPLNPIDAPGYFLSSTSLAVEIMGKISATNVKLMFDCYHVGRAEGDVTTRMKNLRDHIGHIQFASVPARGRPDQGELNYDAIFEAVAEIGWTAPLGAEYKPGGDTDDTLGWLKRWQ